MTDVQKQLLCDYADGRPLALMTRDLGCHANTLTRRIDEALAEIDRIPDYRRRVAIGNETMASYWKIKYMRSIPVQARKSVRATTRWSKLRVIRSQSQMAEVHNAQENHGR